MVCLDTSFLIDFIGGDKRAVGVGNNFVDLNMDITVSSISVMELVRGLYTKNVKEGEREKVNELISSLSVLSFGKKSAILAGEIEDALSKRGENIDLEDVMIAAVAISNNERLVTNNKRHFEKIKGLELEIY